MRKTIAELRAMKAAGQRISMLTAYDASMAKLMDDCGIDILLVGDSVGNVLLGYDSTVPVTMEEMLHHCKAVRRGAPNGFILGDMPFGSYQVDIPDAIRNGLRFVKEAGCDGVKLEGGESVCPVVKALTEAGIPVMAHIGLTPQTASQLGGYKVQGKTLEEGARLLREAKALEAAGAFSVLMECVPEGLAKVVTEALTVPTIGIGAGLFCDGQVLVVNDMLGMFEKFTPKFVKKYTNLAALIREGITNYNDEVKAKSYPDPDHSFTTEIDYSDLLKS